MSDCALCPVESKCFYPCKPCDCVGQRKFWPIERFSDGNGVVMPKALTAENGAKAALIGDFRERITQECDECAGSGSARDEDGIETGEDCERCGGSGEVLVYVTISWDNIKAIYDKAVELYGRPL